MSLYDSASLAMIPSGIKDGKLYSAKPTDGAGDFTFTRGSNLAATRVDENGLIEKGRENLLLQSNQFDTTWENSGSAETGGQLDKDGGNDAWLLTKSSADGYIYQNISYTGVQTYSVYLKANSLNWARLQINVSSGTVLAYFDLLNGVIGDVGPNNIDTIIESVGNGWYRCSISTNNTSTRVRIYPAQANNDVSGTSGSIYIQDAQLELGLVATDYIETGATTEQAGILENLPRLDYTDSSCPSLLLEPTRTNIITHSEYFADSSWSKSINPSIFSTSEVSPDGSTGNVYRFSASNANVFVSPTTGVQYTISFYVKSNGAGKDKFKLRLGSNESSDITATNEWVRHSYTATADSAVAGIKTAFSPDNEVDILIYGAQLEAGSYPTSYIPTYGTSVTRSVDSCSVLNVASLIGQSEGTILFDAKFQDADRVNFSLSDSTANNHITIDTSSSYSVFARIVAGGVTQAEISTITSYFSNGDTLKCAVAYAANDFAFYINGTQIGVDASGTIPLCDDIKFARYNGSINAYQNVNKVLLFKSRLSNTELIALTTI